MARNYRKEYDKFQDSASAIKKRTALNRMNYKKGTYGNEDGLDVSHTEDGIRLEKSSTNKGRKEKSRMKGSKRKQQGGYLKGASHKDGGIAATIGGQEPVELEGGEYIIKKSSAKKLGTKALNEINKKGRIPTMAQGGKATYTQGVRGSAGKTVEEKVRKLKKKHDPDYREPGPLTAIEKAKIRDAKIRAKKAKGEPRKVTPKTPAVGSLEYKKKKAKEKQGKEIKSLTSDDFSADVGTYKKKKEDFTYTVSPKVKAMQERDKKDKKDKKPSGPLPPAWRRKEKTGKIVKRHKEVILEEKPSADVGTYKTKSSRDLARTIKGDDPKSVKAYQASAMGMKEGDAGFGTLGPKTLASLRKTQGKKVKPIQGPKKPTVPAPSNLGETGQDKKITISKPKTKAYYDPETGKKYSSKAEYQKWTKKVKLKKKPIKKLTSKEQSKLSVGEQKGYLQELKKSKKSKKPSRFDPKTGKKILSHENLFADAFKSLKSKLFKKKQYGGPVRKPMGANQVNPSSPMTPTASIPVRPPFRQGMRMMGHGGQISVSNDKAGVGDIATTHSHSGYKAGE